MIKLRQPTPKEIVIFLIILFMLFYMHNCNKTLYELEELNDRIEELDDKINKTNKTNDKINSRIEELDYKIDDLEYRMKQKIRYLNM
jgi:peptidoglycan hydrolase CwlO-like protein